jgi:hypothetical protein
MDTIEAIRAMEALRDENSLINNGIAAKKNS